MAENNTALWIDGNPPQPYPADLYPRNAEPPAVEDWGSIGATELEAFGSRGYLAIRNAFPAERLAEVLDAFHGLVAGRCPEFRGIQFEAVTGDSLAARTPGQRQDAVRKLWQFVGYDPRLQACADHPPLLALLERLMGEPATLFQDMALFKPPHLGREKPWHQDHAYFALPLGTPVIGVWIALDEATVDNGCMCVLPGSHLQGPRPHFARRDWQLCDSDVERGGAVAIPLPPGGGLLFHGMLCHGTPANRTPQRRRAVQFHYKPASIPFGRDEDRLALFGAEGKNVSC